MEKILTIAWKELYTVSTDRVLLLFMLGTPLAISLIIGLAFGSSGGELTIGAISVAVVNLDQGDGEGNLGETVASILLSEPIERSNEPTCQLSSESAPAETRPLSDFLNAKRLNDPELARAGVDEGIYAAAVIIPADFTSKVNPPRDPSLLEQTQFEKTQVEVYGSGASTISATIVRSITETVIQPFVTASAAIRGTVQTIFANPLNAIKFLNADESAFAGFACAYNPNLGNISLGRQALNDVQARSAFEQILIRFGSAQAVFFSLFTAWTGVQSVYRDRDTWVLQRLLSSPTSRLSVLAGKLLGVQWIIILQILLLLIFLSIIASISNGAFTFLWGENWLALVMLLLSVSLAVSGVGVFVVGLARTPEQATLLGTMVNMGLALLGGAFGFRLGEFSKLSLIFWGVDGFESLSSGDAAIELNLLVLLIQGLILFSVGSWLFNRRLQV